MKAKLDHDLIPVAVAAAFVLFSAVFLCGQTNPGPTAGSQDTSPSSKTQKANLPVLPQDLDGMWKLNADQSDDPEEKLKGTTDLDIPNSEAGVPPGSQSTQSGSRRRSGGGPLDGANNAGADVKGNQKMLELLAPATSLTVEAKEHEFDLTDQRTQKRAYFTDGRKLQKSKEDSYKQIAAGWNAGRLTFDEKGPRGEKISRTFQLAPDGRQLIETIQVDKGRIYAPIVIRYVYDRAPEGT